MGRANLEIPLFLSDDMPTLHELLVISTAGWEN
jgi:hypothetical protein